MMVHTQSGCHFADRKARRVSKMSLASGCRVGRLLAVMLLVMSAAGASQDEDDDCKLRALPEASTCILQLEADLHSRRPGDPDELSCCLVARLEHCLQQTLADKCHRELGEALTRASRKTKVSIDCDGVTYPSIHCYAYLYRDMISMAMLATLVTFSCYAVIVCCRTFCLSGRAAYRTGHGFKPLQLEQRPLIIVTRS